MNTVTLLPPYLPQQFILFEGRSSAREQILNLCAYFALSGQVRVIDGGNQFNVYEVSRHIRRQTLHLNETLQKIKVIRSFSCYQMAVILNEARSDGSPILILDLLSAFYDENVPLIESRRLLKIATRNVSRLSASTAVIASSRPPQLTLERAGFLEDLKQIAAVVWETQEFTTTSRAKDHGPYTPDHLPGFSCKEQSRLSAFRRALRRSDQRALDDLLTAARQHLAAAAYASDALPMEIFLLAMILEEHKEVMRLRILLEKLQPQE